MALGAPMGESRTLRALIRSLPEHRERPALVALRKENVERWSYAELGDHALRLARGINETGTGRGDSVAVLAANRPEWIFASLGAIAAGTVVVPLDAQLGDDELSRILVDSDARLVFATADQAERLERLATEVGPKLILLDAPENDERSWRRLLADEVAQMPDVGPDEVAALFYTSGTTGAAKGVPLSHGNLAFQLDTLLEAGLVAEDDRILLPLPLHHVYPFVIGMLTPLAAGLPIVLPWSITGPQIVRALREGEVSLIVGVPRLYEALYAGIEERAGSGGRSSAAAVKSGIGASAWLRRRLGLRAGRLLLRPLHERFGPKLRILASGGAALDPDLAGRLEDLGWKVAVGYGLTETSPLLTLNPPEGAKLGSVGRPITGVEVRLDPSAVPDWSEREEERQADEIRKGGEILARGPGVFAGYRNMPEETEEVFTDDGWFRTGDLGHFDEDGHLYVTGRASTLIVTEGGENVQPEDVEEAYLEHPAIREIGVLEEEGKLVALVVPEVGDVRRSGGEVEDAVREAVAERSKDLPSYRRISDHAISREPLEYTQLGKLRRHILEERYEKARKGEEEPEEEPGPIPVEEMSGEDRTLLEDPAAKGVWNLLASRYSDQRLTPETSPQLDLGVDSLEWVNLTLEIGERVGVELDEEAIERVDTVRDLLREVAEAGEAEPQASPLERPEEALSDRQKRWLEPLSPAMSALARCLFVLDRAVMRGPFRLRSEGVDRLPDEGPFVLTPNHTSYLDPFALAAALDYRLLRRTYFAGSMNVAFGNPLNRFVVRLAQAVPVESDRAGTSSLAFGAAALGRGRNLIWFPEGQRSPTGELQPFKPGIGMLLSHSRVPVVPVFIRGTREAMPPGKALPRPAKITVVFGESLDPRDLEQRGEGDQPQERIAHALRESVKLLCERSLGRG
jgi:long-chain acyl-CoA synthetase